jgi:hypothetical protein
MARIQHNERYWQIEAHLIAQAWPDNKAAFRNDESVFNDYIDMQADMCEADGFPDIAFTMRGFREFVPQSKRQS